MCTILVLELPDLSNSFVLEYDVMRRGVRSLLMQEEHSMAFTSKKLCGHNMGKSKYEKEMMAILHAIDTFCPYLIERNFQINTDHHSLKYFLEKKLCSPHLVRYGHSWKLAVRY